MLAVVVRRAVTSLVGLTLLGLGLVLALVAIGQVSAGTVDLMGVALSADLTTLDIPGRIGWSVIAGATFFLGAFFLAAGVFRPVTRGMVLLRYDQFPGGGELSISMNAVRALVARATLETAGVSSAIPVIKLKRAGWFIDCDVVVSSEAELPTVAKTARERIQIAVERHTGLPVARLRVHSELAIAGAGRVR